MTIIKNIPWKALLILTFGLILGFVVGAKKGHKITWLTTEKVLNTDSVKDGLNKPSSVNHNSTSVNFNKKIKKVDTISISVNPSTDQKATTNIEQPIDSCYSLSDLKQLSIKEIRKIRRK